MSVGEIAETLGCAQPTASRQLARLAEANVLDRHQDGTTVRYSIGDPTILELCETVCGSLEKKQAEGPRRLFT